MSEHHIDSVCLNTFFSGMQRKMQLSREKGKYGWHDPEVCTIEYLKELLREHVEKGDMVDVANLAMMIHHREKNPQMLMHLRNEP